MDVVNATTLSSPSPRAVTRRGLHDERQATQERGMKELHDATKDRHASIVRQDQAVLGGAEEGNRPRTRPLDPSGVRARQDRLMARRGVEVSDGALIHAQEQNVCFAGSCYENALVH